MCICWYKSLFEQATPRMNNIKPHAQPSTIIRRTTQVNLMPVTAFTHFFLLAHSLKQAKREALF